MMGILAYARASLPGCALALLMTGAPALALDIKTEQDAASQKTILRLSGNFEPGDGLKLRGHVAKLPPDVPIIAYFNAGGGSFNEAMSVGRFLHQVRIPSVVPEKARCISPCPLAFLGGADAAGSGAWVKHTTGSIGFTPFLASAPDKDYTYKDLEAEAQKTQQSILAVLDYLIEVGADPDILPRFYDAIPAGGARYMSDDELLSIGVSIFDDASKEVIDARAILRRARR